MKVHDGDSWTTSQKLEADFVVVGSGPAGAAVARVLAKSGASVWIFKEGPYVLPHEFPPESGDGASGEPENNGVRRRF